MAEHVDLNESKAQERTHCPPALVMEDVTPELPISWAPTFNSTCNNLPALNAAGPSRM
jgi:hypothetical protein